ncbi:TniQ family protein [Roseomonas xinghualingensis]|uniref:TniQ family protein n=1 Tax=Roseomonas xinghualingensis TaxID=2986475 RepID=UPI00366D39D5
MPIIPPMERDELISSWLDRTARFYDRPLQALLLGAAPRSAKPIELSEVDLGTAKGALRPVAALLGISIEHLAAHTIAAAYSWGLHLVARGTFVPDGHRSPRLRYAACPHCLERQRADRGISWLTRAWILAPRTVCSIHHVPLVEGHVGSISHPIWSDFLRRHRHSNRAVCAIAQAPSAPVTSWAGPPFADNEAAGLHRQMATIQDGILAGAAQETRRRGTVGEGRARVTYDLVWAFTRADRHYPDRLVYEAFASDLLDSPWHVAQRRRPGPVDFPTLSLHERHVLLATATVLTGPQSLRRQFCQSTGPWQADLATLHRRLKDDDRAELAGRQRKWNKVPESTI